MALSTKARKRLEVAMARRAEAKELADAVDALHAVAAATHVAPLGSTTNIPVASTTLSTSDTYTDAAVKTAIDLGDNTLRTAVEARLDAIEAKVDALLAALVAAGLMA